MGRRGSGNQGIGSRVAGIGGLGLLLVLVLAGVSHAQGTGVFEGQVVNGTTGGPKIGAGVAVTLRILRGETEVDTLEATTDAAGHFVFEGLDTDPALQYSLQALYLDVPYKAAQPYQFDGEHSELSATVTVFETTDDDSSVVLDAVHFIAQSFGEVLRLTEVHLLGNTGDRTYVGREGTTVFIPVPQDAVGLAFEEGAAETRFVEVEGGFSDSAPVPPGQETSLVFFSYHLMVSDQTILLERSFSYPVSGLSVLVAQPGLELESEQLQSMGSQEFQGQRYEFFAGQPLLAGAPLAMEFRPVEGAPAAQEPGGMPPAGEEIAPSRPPGGNQELLRWLGFALAGLAVVGVIVYAATGRKPGGAAVAASVLEANPKARPLLTGLADLEDAYAAGEIDGADYERRRAEMYEALRAL